MLNQVAVEALYSAKYVENYLDIVENLPGDVQRHLSRMRELDVQHNTHLRDAQYHYENWLNCQNDSEASIAKRGRSMARMQQSMCAAQDIGDEKLQVVNQLQEFIDTKTKQLDQDQQALDYGKDSHHMNDVLAKECLPITSSLASPIHVNAVSTSSSSAAVPSASSLITPQSSAIGSSTGGDRFNATSNTNASGGGASAERTTAKRARRRNDNSGNNNNNTNNSNANTNTGMEISGSGAGVSGGGIGLADNSQIIDNQSSKQMTNAAAQSSNSTQKKASTNASGGNGGNGNGGGSGNVGGSSGNTGTGGGGGGKKKKRKSGRQTTSSANVQAAAASSSRDTRDDTPPIEEAIDPDEPTYCLCDQISFGEMILCDNDLCPIEWFHFSCVSLMSKPKGKWFCPNCRGERPNVMKPKAQFLKELALYNKEKEEKT